MMPSTALARFWIAAALAAGGAVALLDAPAGQAASYSATASVRILSPLTVTEQSRLDFGLVKCEADDDDDDDDDEYDDDDDDDDECEEATKKKSGTVVVTPQGQRSSTGGIALAGSFSPAIFRVAGTAGASFTIALPSTVSFGVTPSSPGAPVLTVNNLTAFSVNLGAVGTAGALGANGQDTVKVGGTLIVTKSAKPGRYVGTVPITVSYQ